MDIQKDNLKDKGITNLSYDPDLFHNDQQFYVAYKKLERIISAVFLVTGLIEGSDSIKKSVEEHGLACLAQYVSLVGKSNVSVVDIQNVAARLLHLNSLLDIGFWSGKVSHMNLTILQQEISNTYKLLNNLSSTYKNEYYISASFFKSNEELTHEAKEKDSVGKIKDPKRQDKGQNVKDKTIRQSSAVKSDENKGQRRETILALLREKSNLTIKDFSSVVSEYSEKTIQRELGALVEEGVVHKEGERRWSTYSLAK